MARVLDGYPEHVAHASRRTGLFWNRFQIRDYAVDLNICLKHIELSTQHMRT